MNSPYRLLGLGLCLGGAVLAPISYLVINSASLTAVFISTFVLGLVSIALANTRPPLSPEACELMLKTGAENTAALLEELGVRSKAVYLPSSMRDGHSEALVPLVDREIRMVKGKVPGRLLVRYGASPEEMAIAVTTPGSIGLGMLEAKPGPSPVDIEVAATYILTGVLDLARSVKVSMADARVDVEIAGPRLHYQDTWFYQCLGSPIASIIAAVSSEALGKPVRIQEEHYSKGKDRIVLEVLS